MKTKAYIFQHNKTVAHFAAEQLQINDSLRAKAGELVSQAIVDGRAEKGYYRLEIVSMDSLIVSDSEDLIA